ncbi:MAG: 50S ribosomal protein L17, partial [Peptococcus niger]
MNHRKIGTDISHRRAILRNMTTSVLENGRVETTVPKAKEVRRQVEKMITLGKKGDLAAYRKAMAYLTDEDVVQKL